jgi:hypothetical protein
MALENYRLQGWVGRLERSPSRGKPEKDGHTLPTVDIVGVDQRLFLPTAASHDVSKDCKSN